MAHAPFPFFKSSRGVWYCQIGPAQHNLGRHPEGLPAPQKKQGKWEPPACVLKAFYRLMAEQPEDAPGEGAAPAQESFVLGVFEAFLDWAEKHKEDATYVWYRRRIQSFARTIARDMPVADLRPIHVEHWVDAHPGWSPGHQRGSKVAVQRAFGWAEKMGLIDRSPVRHLSKPEAGKRERVIRPEEYAAMMARYEGDPFGRLLEMSWQTGCRPQEAVRVEARHLDAANRRVVLPPKEAKGKRRFRIIYLNDRALALVTGLAADRPEGPIFRNTDVLPWNAQAVNNRFCRLQQHLGRKAGAIELDPDEVKAFAATLRPDVTEKGVKRAKTPKELLREARKKLRVKAAVAKGEKLCLYAFRHTFAQRLLLAGTDALTVSTLLGHVDSTMLSKVYSHLQQNGDHLLNALNGVTG